MLTILLLALLAPLHARDLDDRIGRTEVRVHSDVFELRAGRTPAQLQLPARLQRLGYTKVSDRPTQPGQYFLGSERVWIYRHEHRARGRVRKARLLGLELEDGVVVRGLAADERPVDLRGRHGWWLEPEVLSESLTGTRMPRDRFELETVPEHVWRPLLALEDDRFFKHAGVSGRAIARAALANAKAGQTVQGGSTITQQLIKNRDLTPKRSLDRKASEAMRALAVEARYTKEDILEAYLNTVYYGHVNGVAVHGLDAAAAVFFSKEVAELSLAESALMAAVVQGPNGLSPIRHPEAAKARRDHALERLLELGWASESQVDAAKSTPITLDLSEPERPLARHFRGWVADEISQRRTRRSDKGLGFGVETTLDPWLQAHAEEAVAEHLRHLRKSYPKLASLDVGVALVALDADTGAVRAWVGTDPEEVDDFDRVSEARRQPGSTLKPLILLEAFDTCGAQKPLHPATLVSDATLTVELDSGQWQPSNYDAKHHGLVSIRSALRHSYNIPFVRVTEYCGRQPVASRLQRAGLDMPDDPPPSFALGALETTPLTLAGAYTAFADLGRASEPWGLARLEGPKGRRMHVGRGRQHRVAPDASAFLVRHLLDDVVEQGTGRGADVRGLDVVGKTGTSSGTRDAWFAGEAGGLVTVVWVGLDGSGRLGLTGSSGAAPLWKDFMEEAALVQAPWEVEQPRDVVTRRVDPETGLVVGMGVQKEGEEELFRRGAIPASSRFWKKNRPARIIE